MANGVKTAGDSLVIKRWLAITPDGGTKISVGPPRLSANAVAIGIEIVIPKAVFRKPRLEARIMVPANAGAPETITAKTADNMAAAIKQATGLTLAIAVKP